MQRYPVPGAVAVAQLVEPRVQRGGTTWFPRVPPPSPRGTETPKQRLRPNESACGLVPSGMHDEGEPPKFERYPVPGAVAVAQLVEPRVVVPVVAGSNPVRHP